MPAPTKTIGTTLLALQSVASNTVIISSEIDVSGILEVSIGIHFGRRAATALTESMRFRVEASCKSSGNGHWFPIFTVDSAIAAAESEAVNGTVNSGTNVITVASTTNLAAGDLVFIDNGTIANSEWGRVKSIASNTSITIEDNLVNAQTGATIYDQAEIYNLATLNVLTISRLRLVADGRGTGQATAVEAWINTVPLPTNW